ncbi:hypothetical protein GOV07_02985 [Candidatus Woesearchaeota archaeon]|nr:hypothetical protein [Candidatus Woesearchaeota archaeon]
MIQILVTVDEAAITKAQRIIGKLMEQFIDGVFCTLISLRNVSSTTLINEPINTACIINATITPPYQKTSNCCDK